jgi:hypothetical protein
MDSHITYMTVQKPLKKRQNQNQNEGKNERSVVNIMKQKVSIQKKIEELESRLSRARYGQAGMFPHPGWAEEEKECEKQLAKLRKKRKK